MRRPSFQQFWSKESQSDQLEYVDETDRPKTGRQMGFDRLFEEIGKIRKKVKTRPALKLIDCYDIVNGEG